MTAELLAVDLLPAFEQHSTDDWAAVQVPEFDPDRCVICRGPGGPECATCAAGWDYEIARRGDL